MNNALASRGRIGPLDRLLCAYVRHVPHCGQERMLNFIEGITRRSLWTVKALDSFLISIDRHDMVQRHIMLHGHWDKEVGDALVSILQPRDVFYDVGANIGYFSLLAASLGVKCVVAFEPYRPLAGRAAANMARNALESRVRVVPAALGANQCEARYLPGPATNSGAGAVRAGRPMTGCVDVHVTTLDAFIESGGPPPNVMKIDVEGFEAEVLRGGAKLLRENPPRAIIFEGNCGPDGTLEDQELAEILEGVGYHIRHLSRDRREPLENYLAVLP